MNAEIIQSTTGDCKTLAEKLLRACRLYCSFWSANNPFRTRFIGTGSRNCKCEFDREFF
jgi:hypothetical protein